MGKYEPLRVFLGRQQASEVPVTFAEIERLIAAPLPPVARKHRAWWSNNGSNNVMTKAWLEAGFRSESVDMSRGRLVFRRASSPANPRPQARFSLDRIRAELGGTIRLLPGVDLTDPAIDPDEWGGN